MSEPIDLDALERRVKERWWADEEGQRWLVMLPEDCAALIAKARYAAAAREVVRLGVCPECQSQTMVWMKDAFEHWELCPNRYHTARAALDKVGK